MLVVHELLEVIFRISVATLFEVEKAVQDYGGVFVAKDLFVIIRFFKCFTDDRNVFGDAFGALGQFFILLCGRLEQFIVWIGGDVQQVLWDFVTFFRLDNIRIVLIELDHAIGTSRQKEWECAVLILRILTISAALFLQVEKMVDGLVVLLQVSILNYAQKLIILGIIDFDIPIGVSYCQAQTMVQESHALHTALFGFGWLDFTYGDFFAEIVESDGTVLVANNDDGLHLVCNHVADWRRNLLELLSELEHSRLIIEYGNLRGIKADGK